MLAFPQLSTGAYAQFPLERTRVRRTVANRAADGSSVRYADSGAGRVRWDLPFVGLTTAEAAALRDLFSAAEGRLRTFTFLDPAANLAAWSEDLARPAWQASPLMQTTAGVADPLGATRATRVVNASQSLGHLAQELAVPPAFVYTVSLYAKSPARSPLALFVASQERFLQPETEWRRFSFTAAPGGSGTSVPFGFQLPAGALVDIFGFQVEAQPAPSTYMRSQSTTGVYPRARFDQDELTVTAQGPDNLEVRVRIVSPDGV